MGEGLQNVMCQLHASMSLKSVCTCLYSEISNSGPQRANHLNTADKSHAPDCSFYRNSSLVPIKSHAPDCSFHRNSSLVPRHLSQLFSAALKSWEWAWGQGCRNSTFGTSKKWTPPLYPGQRTESVLPKDTSQYKINCKTEVKLRE